MAQKTRKILLFSTAYLPQIGGAELALKDITDRMSDVEFDLITALPSASSPRGEAIGNVRVHRVGFFNNTLSKLLLPILGLFKFYTLQKQYGPYDAIFALQASFGGGAAWLVKKLNPHIPFILNIQEGKELHAQSFFVRLTRGWIIRSADTITVISSYLKTFAGQIGGKNVHLIPNGVDITHFSQEYSPEELTILKNTLSIKSEEYIVVSASRLVSKNGIDILIRAIVLLPATFKLLLLGEGSQRAELELLVKDLGVGDRVLFAGTIPTRLLPKYLKLAHIFARPSRSEGLGTAFLEAMVAGLPVIATSVGGIPDFLKDRETGLLVSKDNPQALAYAIEELIKNDTLRNHVVAKAKEMVQKHYDWDMIAREYETIFQSK